MKKNHVITILIVLVIVQLCVAIWHNHESEHQQPAEIGSTIEPNLDDPNEFPPTGAGVVDVPEAGQGSSDVSIIGKHRPMGSDGYSMPPRGFTQFCKSNPTECD